MKLKLAGWGAGLAALCASLPATAQTATSTLNGADMAWVMTSTALVLMMTIPGLALFYGGMVKRASFLSILMKCFATCSLVSIFWLVIGYSLAFSGSNGYIGDFGRVMLSGIGLDTLRTEGATIPESLFALYQMTFAIITPALIAGAFAERMRFPALLAFMTIWMLVVYAPVAHAVWGGGFLGAMGVLDFAGGTVVHINAGVAGLIAALVLGPRLDLKKAGAHEPQNLALSLVGASLLWVGWFGFNGGSALASNSSAVMAMLVTQIAAAAAALSWMFAEWLWKGTPSIFGKISGAVAGLVAITPAAGFVEPWAALVIGLVAGAVCFWASTYLKEMLGYDDFDTFGIHGVGGILGAILTGVFAVVAIGKVPGAIEGNWDQVWIQTKGVIYTVIYSGIATYVILKVIGFVTPLRVDAKTEREGLDAAMHGNTVR